MNWMQILQMALAAIEAILQEIQAGGGTATADQSARLFYYAAIKQNCDTLMESHMDKLMAASPMKVSHQ